MPLLALLALLGSLTPIYAQKEVPLGDGEHLAADKPLAVADEQDFLEQRDDLGPQGTDKGGKGGKVRGAVAGQGNEGDLHAAGALDGARADDAAAVGEQDDLEQHRRRVGAGAGEVVLVAGIEALEIDLAIDEVVQGMLESAGQKLPLQIDGKKPRAGINVLVAGHAGPPKPNTPSSLDIPFGSRQDALHEKSFSTASLGVRGCVC